MKEAVWGGLIIILGIIIFVILLLVNNYTTTNESDYYVGKEAAKGAMEDSIDWTYFNNYGEVKINKEKFVENFIRRFSESTNAKENYQIDFYQINEVPPKVSIRISTTTEKYVINQDAGQLDVVNTIDAILEQE